MGVPAFYRWLTERYPKIVVYAKEEKHSDDATGAVDATARNPNEFEFDNLYIDMNGCIHPCFHPDDGDPHAVADLPTTFEDVFSSVFRYIDRIFNIVRPRKLLYLAIDGVAPRAKMNQQRARRFQTAKTKEIAEEEENRLRREYEHKGKNVLPQVQTMVDDSNVITPGTEFMFELSKALQLYITTRIRDIPAWREIKVILSDANVPGEGEHKIMSFIRSQRTFPGYNPNTRHCLYGLDADLIMLALATHELHFSILREEVLTVKEEQPLSISSSISSFQNANFLNDTPKSRGWFKPFDQTHHQKMGSSNSPLFPVKKTCKYQFLHLWILREYLELDLHLSSVPDGFKYDFERVVDDFIFMCFFVGNDFLPHMPTLEIHECAIDLLMHVYKKEFKSLGGYLVDTQRVNEHHTAYIKLTRVEKFILIVGNYEEMIFAKRIRMKERRMRRILNELSDSLTESNICDDKEETSASIGSIPLPVPNLSIKLHHNDIVQNTNELKEELKKILKKRSDTFSCGSLGTDKVKFGLIGWKERYYREKFSVDNPLELESTRKSVVKEYTEGLCWVLLYYFSGVPSWTWFYPYHYGPCASDLRGMSHVKVNFQLGLPFTPFDQLMAVLPPRSAHALPRAYRETMTDPSSVLQSFYPKEFAVDVDGKRYLWQGVCLLPFIDEKMLLSETNKVASKIQDYEAERNAVKVDKVFVGASSKFGSQIQSLFLEKLNEESRKRSQCIEVSLSVVDSVAGSFHLSDDDQQPSDAEKMVLCLNYELPRQRKIVQRPLAGVNFPEMSVYASDIDDRMLWHEHNYHRPVSRMPRQNPYPRTESGEDSQHIQPGGRGWSPQGRGRGGAPPSYNATASIGNSSSGVSDSGVSGPRIYIPPHQRSGSVRPVAPFRHRSQQGSSNMMWALRPAYSVATNFHGGRSGYLIGSGSGRGFVSNNEFGGDGGNRQHRPPIYNNHHQRGRGRGYTISSATD